MTHASLGCFTFAVAGGLIAQAPDPSIGTAGLLVAITGLVGGITSGAKVYLDWRLKMRQMDIDKLASELAETKASLAEALGRIGRNTDTLRAVVPAVKTLAGQSGVHEAIPEQATDPNMRTIQ